MLVEQFSFAQAPITDVKVVVGTSPVSVGKRRVVKRKAHPVVMPRFESFFPRAGKLRRKAV